MDFLPMRRKFRGYILTWAPNDHDGNHVHIKESSQIIGVYEISTGQKIRGLDRHWNRALAQAVTAFVEEINQRQR